MKWRKKCKGKYLFVFISGLFIFKTILNMLSKNHNITYRGNIFMCEENEYYISVSLHDIAHRLVLFRGFSLF